MKKLFVMLMCLCLALVSGCTPLSVSQEEYDSLTVENSRLRDEQNKNQTINYNLVKELEKIRSEKAELEKALENKAEQNLPEDNIGVDILAWIMARPQSTIVSSEISNEEDWLTTETSYFKENSDISVKIVHTVSDSVSDEKIAAFIHSYELKQAAAIPELFSKQSGVVELLVVYRYDDGKIIMTACWYNYQNDTITYGYSWGRYGENVKREYSG